MKQEVTEYVSNQTKYNSNVCFFCYYDKQMMLFMKSHPYSSNFVILVSIQLYYIYIQSEFSVMI